MWKTYLPETFEAPTKADRTRLERLGGGRLPDTYWRIACAHQGQVLEDSLLTLPGQGVVDLGVILLAIPPEKTGDRYSYAIEWCLDMMSDLIPARLLPFADDTGGNSWAFDFRADADNPSVVFIDHELADEEAITPAAPDFATFMMLIPGLAED